MPVCPNGGRRPTLSHIHESTLSDHGAAAPCVGPRDLVLRMRTARTDADIPEGLLET